MLSATMTKEVKKQFKNKLIEDVKRIINFSRGEQILEPQASKLKSNFITLLMITDTQTNLLFPFCDKFSEVLASLDLDIILHQELLVLCGDIYMVFALIKKEEDTLIPKFFHHKLQILSKRQEDREFICNSITQAVREQSPDLRLFWEAHINKLLKDQADCSSALPKDEVTSISSFALRSSGDSCSGIIQLQDQDTSPELLADFKEKLNEYKKSLAARDTSLSSRVYKNACWMVNMDVTVLRLSQVEDLERGLTEISTNHEFFDLLTKHKELVKQGYGAWQGYTRSSLYKLLEDFCEQYDVMIRKDQSQNNSSLAASFLKIEH